MPWQNPIFSLSLSVISLALAGFAVWQIVSLNKLRKTFFLGKKAANLEDVIVGLKRELKGARDQQADLEHELAQVKNNLSFAVQKLGLVRFNPFEDGGGNFSFSLALLDAHNNGIIVTSMHGRQQNRIYSKKIENGKCESQLTEEEMQALEMANEKNQDPRIKIQKNSKF